MPLPTCTCGSSTPGAHGLGCPRSPAYHPRYRAALIIGRPDRLPTQRLPRFAPAVAATAWIAELRTGKGF